MLKFNSQLMFGILTLTAVTMTSFAQPAGREIVNQSIEWFSFTNNVKLSKRLTLMLDAQVRFARDFEPLQNQARTGLDIKINDHLSIMPLAYVYTWNYKYGKQPASY